MNDLAFRLTGTKAVLIRNGKELVVSRDLILEIYQSVLGHVNPQRDYSNITSTKKLLRVLDLEFDPDDSDDEHEQTSEPLKTVVVPVKTVVPEIVKMLILPEPVKTVVVEESVVHESENELSGDDSDSKPVVKKPVGKTGKSAVVAVKATKPTKKSALKPIPAKSESDDDDE